MGTPSHPSTPGRGRDSKGGGRGSYKADSRVDVVIEGR